MYWRGEEGKFDFTQIISSSSQHSSVPAETSAHNFPLKGKEKIKARMGVFPAVWDLVREDHFSLSSSRGPSHEMHEARVWKNQI